jgi:hypothetical protein
MENTLVYLYHVGNPFFRESISKDGLLPKIGGSYSAHYGEKNNMGEVIFVSTRNNYSSTYDDDRYLITLTEEEYLAMDFKKDRDVRDGLYTHKPIPAKHLSLIHIGTGLDMDWCEGDICNNIKTVFDAVEEVEEMTEKSWSPKF